MVERVGKDFLITNIEAGEYSYVQEAGRGGRDKKHAISYVLFDPTEYIELTIDKINDIRYLMGQDDPVWLECYINKFVLADDIRDLCQHNGATDEQIDRILDIIRKQGFLENIDKDINLWFHNNSFRGLFKEKVILVELTDRIMNAKPTRLIEVQGKLRDLTGNEDFSESHTGLEDVLIEKEILKHCFRQHKKMRKNVFEKRAAA